MLSRIQHSYQKQQTTHLFRMQVLFLAFVFIGLCILYQLYRLQIRDAEMYTKLSQQNRIKSATVQAQRGKIYDRNHQILAYNIPVFHIDIRFHGKQASRYALEKLEALLHFSPKHRQAIHDQIDQAHTDQIIRIDRNHTLESISQRYAELTKIPHVEITPEFIRDYPCADACVAVTGYSVANKSTRKTLKASHTKLIPATYTGKTGVEYYYDNLLTGTDGQEHFLRNAKGNILSQTAKKTAIAGHDIVLTIDMNLQKIIHRHMQNHRGAVVVSNPQNGEVLGLYSGPSYSPNAFSKPDGQNLITAYLKDSKKPLFNRAIKGLFPPASTVKPFLALGALDRNIIDLSTTIHDPGYFKYPNSSYIYHNWFKPGHGKVNIKKAITLSNDTFYYHLALKLGIENIHDILRGYRFGMKTGIDLPGESTGLVPNKAWKSKRGQSWYIGDTIITGIGQGLQLSTPIQMARSLNILATNAKTKPIHLLKESVDASGNRKTFISNIHSEAHKASANWASVVSAMRDVITYGTGSKLKETQPYLAGKTGTAQVIRHSGRDQNNAKHLLDHSWFIGFTPSKKPTLAITVILENENNATLVAKSILDDYQMHTAN